MTSEKIILKAFNQWRLPLTIIIGMNDNAILYTVFDLISHRNNGKSLIGSYFNSKFTHKNLLNIDSKFENIENLNLWICPLLDYKILNDQ